MRISKTIVFVAIVLLSCKDKSQNNAENADKTVNAKIAGTEQLAADSSSHQIVIEDDYAASVLELNQNFIEDYADFDVTG